MASAFARTLPSSLSSRTLFVKCSPAPSTFTERRAILKALATTGADTKIEVFKKLEDSSSFIAVTTEPESARSLVSESPYQRIVHLQDSAKASLFSTAAWGGSFRPTITDPVNVQPLEEWREGIGSTGTSNNLEHSSSLGLISKTFTIHVFPANPSFSHKRAVESNPLHGPWPRNDGYDTYVSMALKKAVPGGRMSPGLRDWDTGKQISQGSLGREDEGAESLLGSKSRRSYFIEKRRRKAETELPDVMKSLAAVAKSSTATLSRQEPAQDAIKPSPGSVLPSALDRIDTQSVPSPSGSIKRHNNVDKDKLIAPSDSHDMFKGS